MPETVAPAKINLFLHVGPVRDDGYHPVCSLMEKVSLFDCVSLEISSRPGIRLDGTGVPEGPNTIEQAAALLSEFAGRPLAADFFLEKQIPVAAGLAGGSSDAAAALRLLQEAARIEIPADELAGVAARVGADVPFFLEPGAFLAEGAGTSLTAVDITADYSLVIATPDFPLSTREVYSLYDEMCRPDAGGFARRCSHATGQLPSLDAVGALAAVLHNDLETPAIHLCPRVAGLKERLLEHGAAGALMSGSGPTVFGLFATVAAAAAAARKLAGPGIRVWAARPLPH